jgi:hypothetical protein
MYILHIMFPTLAKSHDRGDMHDTHDKFYPVLANRSFGACQYLTILLQIGT